MCVSVHTCVCAGMYLLVYSVGFNSYLLVQEIWLNVLKCIQSYLGFIFCFTFKTFEREKEGKYFQNLSSVQNHINQIII